jgi:hypothetical protein
MVKNSTSNRDRAEQRLAELQNTTAAAMSFIELEREVIRAKIARLRKQRLAKEAVERRGQRATDYV